MKIRLLFFLIFFIPLLLKAEFLPVETDGACFRYSDTTSVYEFYYSLPDSVLSYKYLEPTSNEEALADSSVKNKFTGGSFKAEVLFSLKFIEYDSVMLSNDWIIEYYKGQSDEKGKNLVGQKNFLLHPGNYTLYMKIYDYNDTSRKYENSFPITIRDFGKKSVGISDIELAQNIESAAKTTRQWSNSFLKSSLYVVPDPSQEILGTHPVIKTYTEIYNAKTISPKGFKLEYKITDPTKEELLVYPKKRNSDNDGLVENVEIPVDAFPSGIYYLNIKLLYPPDAPVDSMSVSKKIYVLNPDMPPEKQKVYAESQAFELSEFATMGEGRVEYEWERSKYIATPYEKDLFKKFTTTDAKRHFLYSFWKRRNTDTLSAYNDFRQKYIDRADYCDKYFSFGTMKDGWRTDRGRVYMIYGEPTSRDYKPTEGNNRPYETWFYAEKQGGMYFYFVDMTGNGNFVQVSSTAKGELQNDNWYNQYVIPQNPNANQNLINTQGNPNNR